MFVSESDAVARSMTDPGGPLFRSFVEHFGPAVVASDGRLDRAALAQIAFRDGRVEELNAIVHPLLGVAQGSHQPPRVVILQRPGNPALTASSW